MNKLNVMNKRADIPIIILVFGVIAICGFVLLSFEIVKNKTEENFLGIDLIEEAMSLEEEYYLYQNLGKSNAEIQNLFDNYNLELIKREGGNIFDYQKLLDLGKVSIDVPNSILIEYSKKALWGKDKVMFRVEYKFG